MTRTRTFVSLATLATVLVGGLSASAALASDDADGSWIAFPERPALPALDYDPRPGVLFVPFEDVTLSSPPNCADGTTQANSAKDCSGVVSNETTISTWGDATAQMALMDGLTAALVPYDVVITNTRPDPYVPYHMLLLSDTIDEPMSESTVCGFAGLGCDGVPRNQVALVVNSTMNCMDRDPLGTALFLFGRLSGLEPVTDTSDPMGRPLDPMNPATTFQDNCVAFEDAMNLGCVGAIHKSYCNDMEGVQNSHQELLGVYGARPAAPDTTAPTIDSIEPADGTVFQASDSWAVTATASDDSGYYVAMWETLEVPAAAEGAVPTCGATNRACPFEFMNNHATTGAPWDFFAVPSGAPAGTYRFRFTAQDMYGNKTSQEISFTVEGGAGGSSGGNTSAGSTSTTGDGTSGGSTGGIESGGGAGGGGDDGGCSCRASSDEQGAFGALALLALGAIRRRR